jgi:hypothetical protein
MDEVIFIIIHSLNFFQQKLTKHEFEVLLRQTFTSEENLEKVFLSDYFKNYQST